MDVGDLEEALVEEEQQLKQQQEVCVGVYGGAGSMARMVVGHRGTHVHYILVVYKVGVLITDTYFTHALPILNVIKHTQ